ncbi:MAG TPA: GIY-YIG nuclease family protein [Verrucomicrobiae bacterium]|nr:GIY-YIG nuclease family protein [Verrucomicrobiae bacterium]
MDFYVYILHCADGSYYTGHTDNLEKRIAEHESGLLPGYTHDRRPVTLAYSATFQTRENALAAEFQIKRWNRAKKAALIRGDWAGVSLAGKKRFRPTIRADRPG